MTLSHSQYHRVKRLVWTFSLCLGWMPENYVMGTVHTLLQNAEVHFGLNNITTRYFKPPFYPQIKSKKRNYLKVHRGLKANKLLTTNPFLFLQVIPQPVIHRYQLKHAHTDSHPRTTHHHLPALCWAVCLGILAWKLYSIDHARYQHTIIWVNHVEQWQIHLGLRN